MFLQVTFNVIWPFNTHYLLFAFELCIAHSHTGIKCLWVYAVRVLQHLQSTSLLTQFLHGEAFNRSCLFSTPSSINSVKPVFSLANTPWRCQWLKWISISRRWTPIMSFSRCYLLVNCGWKQMILNRQRTRQQDRLDIIMFREASNCNLCLWETVCFHKVSTPLSKQLINVLSSFREWFSILGNALICFIFWEWDEMINVNVCVFSMELAVGKS